MSYVGLSYPFRVDHANRRFGTVSSATDTYKAEQIQSFIRTHKNERLMFPSFGIVDPTFDKFDVSRFSEGFNNFYKTSDIKITRISTSSFQGAVTDVLIDFV
jgi:hypothetical protein